MRPSTFDILVYTLLVPWHMLAGSADALAHGSNVHKHGSAQQIQTPHPPDGTAAADNTSVSAIAGDSAAVRTAIETIAHNYLVDIKPIFKQACFDCHTSLTEYPWYYTIPGIKGMIDSDIEEGREHLDFSNDYPFMSHAPLTADLRAIGRVLKDNSMPPIQYALLHWSRSLRPEQKAKVLRWVDDSLALLGNAGYVAAAAD